MNWHIFGHDWAVDHLRRALANGRTRQAYLFVGAEGVGKETLAREFAKALLTRHLPDGDARATTISTRVDAGSHADILYAEAEGASNALKVEEVRKAAGQLALRPYESAYRIAIFRDFDRARPIAQDSLLKTLEEPPPHGVLLLLAASQESILPTITSRSQVLHLRPAPAESVYAALKQLRNVPDDRAQLLAQISGGRVGWALRAYDDPTLLERRDQGLAALEALLGQGRVGRFQQAEALSKDKADLLDNLDLWQSYWRDLLHLAENSGETIANLDHQGQLEHLAGSVSPDEALKALKTTRDLIGTLANTNANPRLALEVALLDYPGLVNG